MTNAIALVLALLVAGALAADALYADGAAAIFLGRRALGLIEWLAFWR